MDFSAINKNNLHHAYFLEGDYETLIPLLLDYLKNESIIDKELVSINKIPVFYIENSREIKELQQTVADGKRIIIIAFDRIIFAAQNALLKTLEEPTKDTHFFFINRNSSTLLPTVRSRMFIINTTSRANTKEDDQKAIEYFSSDYYGRNEIMKDLISSARGEDNEDDEERAASRRSLVVFLDSLERVASDKLHEGNIDIASSIFAIIKAKKDLEDPSPSIKMIFEFLALKLEKIK